MKIAILSQDSNLYSTKRLKEAGEQRGHEMYVIDYLRCYMNITSHKPMVIYGGKPLEGFDAVIPRIGASQTFYGTAIWGDCNKRLRECRSSRISSVAWQSLADLKKFWAIGI
jgi:glutathione synthase/RimK-type ligase-like ATP-grasp enzyme